MKQIRVLLVIMAFAMLFIACDPDAGEGKHTSWFELNGEWEFPNGGHVSVMGDDEFMPGKGQLDISYTLEEEDSYTLEEEDYSYTVDGDVSKLQLIGTYHYFIEGTEHGGDIVVTLSLQKNKLTAKCVGDAPLGGKTFTDGVRQIY